MEIIQGTNDRTPNPVIGYKFTVTADPATAVIPLTQLHGSAGFLVGVGLKLGTTPPTAAATIVIRDIQGITLVSDTFAASKRLTVEGNIPFAGDLDIASANNLVNSASFEIILWVL